MSRSRRARIDALQKRLEHLDKRITDAEKGGYILTYDKAERNALEWAMPILEGHVSANSILHNQLKEDRDADLFK